MSEEVATTPDNVPTTPDNVQTTPEKAPDNAATSPTSPAAEEAAPKKKGRPAGAKDRAPRKKTVKIVEEALVQPDPPEPSASSAPAPAAAVAAAVTPPEEEPMSPRTVLREASRPILELNRLQNAARKTHLGELYSRGLRRL